MTERPLLEMVGVEKRFGDFAALKGVTLSIERGSVTCIVGPSGSGKSTLLRTINMLEAIDAGGVFLRGEMIGHAVRHDHRVPVPARTARAQVLRFGMVFQAFNLFPHLTALENVMLAPVRVLGQDKAKARRAAEALLADVGLADRSRSYPSELSGGQQQRVAIARALAMEPEVLLLDEPTSALDPELVGEVLAVIRRLARGGATMIIVTHEMGFAQEVCDQVVLMDAGEIVEVGAPAEVFANPRTERGRRFFSSLRSG